MLRSIVSRPGRAAGVLLALTGAAILILATSDRLPAQGAKGKSETKVKATATATKPDADGNQVVTVTLDIEKGWHLYANPVGNDDLDGAKTIVTVASKVKLQNVKVEYPVGTVHQDKVIGNYKVYEDRVAIRAHVQRASGDTGPLQVSVKVNACDASKCLPPGEIKLTVP